MTAPCPRTAAGCEDGFAAVAVLALASILVLLACVLAALGAVAVARHRAAAAADLGALAAASRAADGGPAACAVASRIVAAGGARLLSCAVTGDVAEVDVDVRPAGPLGRLGTAHGRARAGPAVLG